MNNRSEFKSGDVGIYYFGSGVVVVIVVMMASRLSMLGAKVCRKKPIRRNAIRVHVVVESRRKDK